MQERIHWRAEGARPILAVDYRGLGTAHELLALLEEQVRAERTGPGDALVLADFRLIRLSAEFLTRARLIGSMRRSTVAGMALLCTTELQHVLLQEYIFATGDHAVRSFTDEQTALRWLLEVAHGRATR